MQVNQLFNKEFYVEEQNTNNIKSTAFYILANITNNCNRNCSYCDLHSKDNIKNLDLDLLYRYLFSFLSLDYRSIVLDIFGGEPTLHKDYLNFFNKIKDNNRIKIRTFSNFTADINIYNNILQNSSLFLTCHNDKSFIEKAFDIDKEFHKKLYFIVMYEKENGSLNSSIQIYKNLLKYFKDSNIELRLIEGVENYYTKSDIDEYFKLISETKQLSNEYLLNGQAKSYYDLINNYNINHAICNTGEDAVYIDVSGKIKYCLQSKYVIGNLYANPIYIKFKRHLCLTSKDCTCNFDTYRKGVEIL